MSTTWFRSRSVNTVTAAVFVLALAALAFTMADPALARGGGGRGGGGGFGGGGFDRGGAFGGGGDFNRGGFSPNTINTGRTNIYNPHDNTYNRNVNVNNGGWGWGWGGDPGYATGTAIGAAAAVGTAAAVGAAAGSGPSTVIYNLPPSCTPVDTGAGTYQYCNGTYYEPVYQGGSVVYQPVAPP